MIILVLVPPVTYGQTSHSSPIAPTLRTQSSPSSNSTAIIGVNPPNITDVARLPGQQVSFTVSITNSSAINLFQVRLTYNYRVLGQPSLDYSNNVLGPNALVLYNCVDNTGSCTTEDDRGVITFGLYIQGNVSVTPPPLGVLFKITFKILKAGFSQLHFTPQGDPFGSTLFLNVATVPVTTRDGFFSNAYCPSSSNHVCSPPLLDFTFSPTITLPARHTLFNVTVSQPTDIGATILNRTWFWGQDLTPTRMLNNATTVTQVFAHVGNYSVSLVAYYSDDVTWTVTKIVPVVAVWIQLLVGQLTITPRYNVYPGTLVQIVANVVNNGTLPATSNVTIGIEGKTLSGSGKQFNIAAFHQSTSVTVTWDTSGLFPRVYRLDVSVIEPLNANSTQGRVGFSYIQLIEPPPSGFALNLGESVGIGIALVAVAGFAVTRLRRRPSFLDEPL